jgi:DNA primase large subunit
MLYKSIEHEFNMQCVFEEPLQMVADPLCIKGVLAGLKGGLFLLKYLSGSTSLQGILA